MTARPNFDSWSDYQANNPPPPEPEPDQIEVDDAPASFPEPSPECFYGLAGRFAQDACKDTEASPIGVLTHLETWAGAYFGDAASLRMGGVIAPPRQNAVVVAVTNGGKGTSAAPVSRLMFYYVDPKLEKLGLLPIQYRDGPMSSGEGLAWAVRDPSDEKNKKTNEPIDPGIDDKRLFILEEEFASALKASQRLGNTLSPAIRGFWDRGSFSPLTKNNRVSATGAHICFVGHITDDELYKEMQDVEYLNGFANRLIWAVIRRPKIVPIPRSIPESTMQDYAAELAESIKFASTLTNGLKLSSASEDLWREVAPKLAKQDTLLSERARPHVLRNATIKALMGCSSTVEPEHIMAALHYWDYSTASREYIFSNAGNAEEDKILDALRKAPMTATEINEVVFQKNAKAEAISQILKSLESKGKIERSQRPPKGGKGRLATVFRVV